MSKRQQIKTLLQIIMSDKAFNFFRIIIGAAWGCLFYSFVSEVGTTIITHVITWNDFFNVIITVIGIIALSIVTNKIIEVR